MGKLLSIAIPSYNVEKYLGEILPHYFDGRVLDDIEILIVNDGSKDRTYEIATSYQDKYPGTVRVINKENGGHGSAVNSGIQAATGKYFKVIDGDDWVDTEAFVQFVTLLQSIDADVVLTSFDRVDDTTHEKTRVCFDNVPYKKVVSIEEVIPQIDNNYQIHSTTFRTDILKKTPKITEHCFYVDQEYIIYPLKYIQTVCLLDIAVYQYRVGNSEQSVAVANLQKNRKMLEKVTLNCAQYIKKEGFDGKRNTIAIERISKLAKRVQNIYLTLGGSTEVYKEWCSFSDQLKQTNIEVYRAVPGNKAKLLRLSNNRLYSLICRLKKQETV